MAITVKQVKKILVLGSGTLGLRVGLRAALSGFDTTIFDINKNAFESATKVHDKILLGQLKKGFFTEPAINQAKSRITWTTDPKVAADSADFVSESVTEDIELKKKVWQEFGALCPAHSVLTSNTSYLLPSHFAKETGSPERFCAFHFHDVFWANVVDIMPHPATEAWLIPFLKEMGILLNQTPVVVKKENPGYIFNSMLMAVIGAAGALLTYDVATIHDIDRSWMGNFKTPSGPFGILDEVGLDTAWHITKVRQDEKSRRFTSVLQTYMDEGKLGVKTGEGFYQYPHPAYKAPDFIVGK